MTEAGLAQDWPALAYDDWADTAETLHLWTQVVGKVRMSLTPPLNHWWHVPLYVSACGLTTSPIAAGGRGVEIVFDFLEHKLRIQCSDGQSEVVALRPISVAQFYRETMAALGRVGVEPHIWTMPCEIEGAIPLDTDEVHRSYDGEAARRFWRVLLQADRVMKDFRARFIGKASPVHFFWGSFDLAVTRFSGRRAPERPGADAITREAYSHEVSSVGWWPGSGNTDAAFYAYMAPAAEGFREKKVRPQAARWNDTLGEYLLMYDDVRTSASPRRALLDFCQSTYEAAADAGHWDRAALER